MMLDKSPHTLTIYFWKPLKFIIYMFDFVKPWRNNKANVLIENSLWHLQRSTFNINIVLLDQMTNLYIYMITWPTCTSIMHALEHQSQGIKFPRYQLILCYFCIGTSFLWQTSFYPLVHVQAAPVMHNSSKIFVWFLLDFSYSSYNCSLSSILCIYQRLPISESCG